MFARVQLAILVFTALYIAFFGFQFVRELNFEFIAYIGLIIAIFAFLYGTLHLSRFPNYILGGISLWGLLHMIGGSVMVGGAVLYAYRIFPFFDGGGDFYVLKFDQVVHAYLYGVVALMFLHLLREVLNIKSHTILVAFISIFAAAGIGGLNEIIEFAAVVVLPETGVGGYENTVLDIIFNTLGAGVAVAGYFLIKKLKTSG